MTNAISVKDRLKKQAIEDKQQSGFWIATWGDGIVFYDTNSGEITRNPQTAVTQDISCCIDMLIDKTQGLVWVTTMNNLYLYQREGKKLIPLNTDEFLSPGYKILDGLCEDLCLQLQQSLYDIIV